MGKSQNLPIVGVREEIQEEHTKIEEVTHLSFPAFHRHPWDIEGYYTTEEPLFNMIRKGLAILLREEGKEKRVEELENSWMVQVHR